MIKEYKSLSDITNLPLISNDGKTSTTYLDNNSVIKLYEPFILELEKEIEYNTERKILNAEPIIDLPEINTPISAIYDDETETFIASRTPYIEGIDFNHINTSTSTNLKKLCNIHIRLENFLKRADKHKIVLPDYASLDNLIIDKNGQFHFIDYDGIQTKDNRSLVVSSSINIPLIRNQKYRDNKGFFTSELNIFSHYVVFFLDVVHANLLTIGKITYDGEITFDDFFEYTGLDDYDIQNKIWKLFQPDKKNEYLEDDIIKIQENYKLILTGTYKNYQMKKLFRK